jgi:hypothetical protein
MVMTVWALLEECAGELAEPFRRSETVGWFRRHHPEVNTATLAAPIQAATVNAASCAQTNPLGARAAAPPCCGAGPASRGEVERDGWSSTSGAMTSLTAASRSSGGAQWYVAHSSTI